MPSGTTIGRRRPSAGPWAEQRPTRSIGMAGEAKQVELTWEGGQSFRGGVPGRPQALVDGHGAEAPSPVDQLLIAAASCSGIDVVLILEKMRATIATFRIEVSGERRT